MAVPGTVREAKTCADCLHEFTTRNRLKSTALVSSSVHHLIGKNCSTWISRAHARWVRKAYRKTSKKTAALPGEKTIDLRNHWSEDPLPDGRFSRLRNHQSVNTENHYIFISLCGKSHSPSSCESGCVTSRGCNTCPACRARLNAASDSAGV